ncbi:BTB/POZ domain-containing protein 3-like [Porites lutea]|uniref:BTB/POZ domain-containing protein 3-like n=1 Tax=Porites lutea TaxID=51062 RepID=UPI003CC65578
MRILLSFVKRPSARIKELTLFQALDPWATKKCEEASTTVDGELVWRFLGEEMIRHFRFSLMSPKEFSDEVEPSGVLQSNEILDVFKQFTSVSTPGGFKFPTSPRKKPNETMPQSCDLGNIRHGSHATHVSRKTGVLTFALTKRNVLLSGVKIVTDKGREYCRVSLAIAHGDKQDMAIR